MERKVSSGVSLSCLWDIQVEILVTDTEQGSSRQRQCVKLRVLSIMNNAISEIKNTLEATNSRITEAEDRISESAN